MKRAVLFLKGRYREPDLKQFKALTRGAYKIAVDGGIRFFSRSGLKPDLIIGDFDSSGGTASSLKRKFPIAEIAAYPKDKDRTDLHLAVDHCLKNNLTRIDIIQPTKGELDHLLGNLMILELINRRAPRVRARLLGAEYESSLVASQSVMISNKLGWILSVVPLSESVRVSLSGVKWPLDRALVRRGESRTLRNEITSQRARVAIERTAFLILSQPTTK